LLLTLQAIRQGSIGRPLPIRLVPRVRAHRLSGKQLVQKSRSHPFQIAKDGFVWFFVKGEAPYR
jgi:hypothetical protein